MTSYAIEVRCPKGPQRLFAKIRVDDETSMHVIDGNVMEFACGDCKRTLRREGFEVDRVLHQYDFSGQFVQTFIEY